MIIRRLNYEFVACAFLSENTKLVLKYMYCFYGYEYLVQANGYLQANEYIVPLYLFYKLRRRIIFFLWPFYVYCIYCCSFFMRTGPIISIRSLLEGNTCLI